jgi:hypothetical protein
MRGVLVFVAGGARLGVPLADVARLTLEGPVAPVPFGHPALAGLMRGDDAALVPVFDLRGLDPAAPRPPTHVAGATVAVVATQRGPVGLRLERLLGTASAYGAAAVDEARRGELASELRRAVGGAGVPLDASAAIGDTPFFFFSAEAFLAAVGLSSPMAPATR